MLSRKLCFAASLRTLRPYFLARKEDAESAKKFRLRGVCHIFLPKKETHSIGAWERRSSQKRGVFGNPKSDPEASGQNPKVQVLKTLAPLQTLASLREKNIDSVKFIFSQTGAI